MHNREGFTYIPQGRIASQRDATAAYGRVDWDARRSGSGGLGKIFPVAAAVMMSMVLSHHYPRESAHIQHEVMISAANFFSDVRKLAAGERVTDREPRAASPAWQRKLVEDSGDFMQAMREGTAGVKQLIADRNNGTQREMDREKEVDKAWDDTMSPPERTVR